MSESEMGLKIAPEYWLSKSNNCLVSALQNRESKIKDLEAENAELKKALSSIIEITHNNYDHDTQRIYKIANEVMR